VGPLLTFFVSGLVIVGAGSFLAARWIIVPLETLSRTARALGSGDLRARAGLGRQDEIGDLGRAFDDMAERIQALLSAERELLANVSHELRTPLARIRVALDLAGEASAESTKARIVEIDADLVEIEALIEDIMTTARLDAAQGQVPGSALVIRCQRMEPYQICEQATKRFRQRFPDRTLQVALTPNLGVVDADPVLFRRVIDNVLENAVKYSLNPDDNIALRACRNGDWVAFEIVDHGIGIPKLDIPKLFTPFFRGDRSRTRSAGGVGLGLTLAKRIVDAHGGTIEVRSVVGEGSTVRVILPSATED